MAKVVTPRGPVALEAARPAPVQSRVIALELHAPAGPGNSDFCYTPQMGNRLWLYGIDVWVYCGEHPSVVGGFFYLMFGSGIPRSGDFMATQWSNIVPLHCGLKPGFRWFACDEFHRHFSMAKLFTTNELRFGVTIENGFPKAWECTVAFEIS
ncbi:unnamed protein product, partial [marine sediment metagenome]